MFESYREHLLWIFFSGMMVKRLEISHVSKDQLMRGLVDLLDCLDDQYYIVLSCVRAP